MRQSGFVLDQFQVGLAASAQGDVGITQIGGEAQGKLIFKKDSPAASLLPTSAKVVNLMGARASARYLAFADEVGTSHRVVSDDGNTLYQVARDKFEKGLEHGLSMASYFADAAKGAETGGWQVSTIETEFDASIGGDFRLAQVDGQGEIVLDLDRATGGSQ